jgi:uncharacterized protein
VSEQQNLEVIRRGYEAFGRGDIGTLLSLCSEDIEWISPGPPEIPTAGRRRGRQEVAEYFRLLTELYDFQRFEPLHFLADGDRVVVIGEDDVRFKATDGPIFAPWVHVFVIKNGKIARFQEYIDMSPVVAEMQAARTRA